jgi:hypothetical protein
MGVVETNTETMMSTKNFCRMVRAIVDANPEYRMAGSEMAGVAYAVSSAVNQHLSVEQQVEQGRAYAHKFIRQWLGLS